MKHIVAASSLALLLLAGGIVADEGLKSGPQVGSRAIPPFNPLHCTGPNQGEKLCLV
jgi:hypothetical protein